MDGIAGVGSRMAQIEARIASFVSTPASRAATAVAAAGTASSFASALENAKGSYATAGTMGTGGTISGTGRLNADGVPAELAAYGNGKIPGDALRGVGQTGHKLWAPAAASLESLMQAARRDGVQIGITDSYRPYDEQVDLARRKGLYSQGGLAAQPGTSDHGWGMAVDLDLDSRAQAWMRTNAEHFGFAEDTPREPWHWGYKVA